MRPRATITWTETRELQTRDAWLLFHSVTQKTDKIPPLFHFYHFCYRILSNSINLSNTISFFSLFFFILSHLLQFVYIFSQFLKTEKYKKSEKKSKKTVKITKRKRKEKKRCNLTPSIVRRGRRRKKFARMGVRAEYSRECPRSFRVRTCFHTCLSPPDCAKTLSKIVRAMVSRNMDHLCWQWLECEIRWRWQRLSVTNGLPRWLKCRTSRMTDNQLVSMFFPVQLLSLLLLWLPVHRIIKLASIIPVQKVGKLKWN